MQGHLQGQKSKSSNNPLHRHDLECHNGEVQSYTTRIIAAERNLLPLRVTEGLYIEKQYPGTSFNERNENGRGNLVRLIATRTH